VLWVSMSGWVFYWRGDAVVGCFGLSGCGVVVSPRARFGVVVLLGVVWGVGLGCLFCSGKEVLFGWGWGFFVNRLVIRFLRRW